MRNSLGNNIRKQSVGLRRTEESIRGLQRATTRRPESVFQMRCHPTMFMVYGFLRDLNWLEEKKEEENNNNTK